MECEYLSDNYEKEVIEENDHKSESEQDTSDTEVTEQTSDLYYLEKDNTTKWNKQPPENKIRKSYQTFLKIQTCNTQSKIQFGNIAIFHSQRTD